ncbi:MAG: SDR family oxidoreductase [Deltaproteobacteria bacterium]|nr:SDR family oxidoreductase [Deltaproteobacteria bacterium]
MGRGTQKVFLVTGFPLFTARKLILHIAQSEENYVAVLVPSKFEKRAKSFIENNNLKTNVRTIIGDIATMHLGFSSEEYRFLLNNVTDVYHFASIYYPNTPDDIIKKVNILGTKNIIQFVKDTGRDVPLNYLSSCMVFENHSGLAFEEPVVQSRYSCFLYKSRQVAEMMIMSESNLLWRIFRAPLIGGDSTTGEAEKLDGFYALLYLLFITDMKFPLPIPHRGTAPLNIVPIDYLIKAVYYISKNSDSTRRIFHIVDPNPVSIKTALDAISKETGKKINMFYPPSNILTSLLKINLLKKLIPNYIPLFDVLNQFIIFSHTNTDKYLKGSGIEAPHFENYLKPMIAFVRNRIESNKRNAEEIQTDDPYGE